ncbi:MAG: HlyD family efflux transporter periplasmic adaptor subunit [Thermoanaerobaculia bacterium]
MRIFLLFLLAGCTPRESIPVYEVERRPFQHRVTAEGNLKATKATRVSVPSDVRRSVRLAWLAAEGTMVEEGEVVARFDPTDMEERLRAGRSDLASASLEVEKTKIEGSIKLTGLETDYKVADLELEHAKSFRKADVSVFSRHDIIEDQIDEKLAGERKEHAGSAQDRQQALGRTELDLLAIKQRKAQLIIDEASQGLQALEVRAPHAGLLTLMRDWNGEPPQVGGEMWRGQDIAEIPDLSKMEAEVFVLEADAGGLEVGKPATVIVEAAPDVLHAATIRRVDAVAKPRSRGSPVQYFGVTLEIEATDPEIMKPGQRVRATLLLAELEDAVIVPRQAVDQESGEARVYVREGGEFVPRPVKIGTASMGLMEVIEGLDDGEIIALRPPGSGGGDEPEETTPSMALGGAG